MRVLLISYTADIHHGWGNITHEYCKALQSKQIDFTLFLPKDEPHYDYITYPTEYILPKYSHTLRRRAFFSYFFYRFPQKKTFSLIHNLFDFPFCYLAYRFSRQLQIPYITGSQGSYGVLPLLRFWDHYFQEKSYQHAYKIITPSQYTATTIQHYSKTKTPFQIIHNGVNYERFSTPVPAEKIKEIRARYPNLYLILGVGGLKERKGFHIVLKALTYLRDYPLKYLIIGKGIMEKELREIVQKEQLQNCVEFLGQKEGEELVSYFQACDLYCHTPINRDFHFEGFGIVFVEANAAGKPVVASISGGVPDAVVSEKTGILAPEGDPEKTAEAIRFFFDHPEKAKEMGQNAQNWAKAHTWSEIADQFINVYQSMQ